MPGAPMSAVQPPLPVRQIGISAGTAFKAGFFGFFGAFVASLIISVIAACVIAVIGATIAESVRDSF